MNLLTEQINKLFYRFLIPSIGGALVISLYSFVDTIAIGQGVGPNGTAAVAVVMPLMTVPGFVAALFGIGASVLFSKARGEGRTEKGNAYYTISLCMSGAVTLLMWIILLVYKEPILRFLGADELLMPYAMDYAKWIFITFPTFVFSAHISSFVRNDGAPNLVVAASIVGGICNVIGDWVFVFPLHMGIEGASLATGIGSCVQMLIPLGYLFTKRSTLKFAWPYEAMPAMKKIVSCGFGASFTEIAATITTLILNLQILRYAGASALAVFGVVVTLRTLFQCIFSGVGQAAQPIVSTNLGAHQLERIWKTYSLSNIYTWICGILFAAVCFFFPTQIIRVFMQTTPEILEITPHIMKIFAISYLPLGISTLAILFLQSVLQNGMSMLLSILRGIVFNVALLFILPIFMKADGIWWSITITETVVAVISLVYMKNLRKKGFWRNAGTGKVNASEK